MDQETRSHYSNSIVIAWREQLAQAAQDPWLAELMLKYGERILRRFIHFYEELRALPRRLRRYVRHRLALSLGAAAMLLALCAVPVHADAITVDGTACTLANAITAANTDAVVGGCTTGNGADTLTLTNDISLTSALPAITSQIIIEGGGHTIARTGGPNFRVLLVNSPGDPG
jgi:hypothetical protein